MYVKGLWKKSHDECPMIHNPSCKHYSTNGKCLRGEQCFFPHRDHNALGQVDHRQDNGQALADRGGLPQATSKAETKGNEGKNKNDDPVVQGGARVLGESVISSSSDVRPPDRSVAEPALGGRRGGGTTPGQNASRSMLTSSTKLLGSRQ